MIVAIEGLIPDRRLSPSGTQPAASPVNAQIYSSQWRRQQPQAAGEEPGDPVVATEPEPPAPQVPEPEPPPPLDPNIERNIERSIERNHPSLASPLITPEGLNRVPAAASGGFDAALHTTSSLRLPFSPKRGPFARRR